MGERLYRIRIPGKNGKVYMDVSKNSGTPKSSILIGFSIINHPSSGTPIFGNTHIMGTIQAQLKKIPSLFAKSLQLRGFWDTHCELALPVRCDA